MNVLNIFEKKCIGFVVFFLGLHEGHYWFDVLMDPCSIWLPRKVYKAEKFLISASHVRLQKQKQLCSNGSSALDSAVLGSWPGGLLAPRL